MVYIMYIHIYTSYTYTYRLRVMDSNSWLRIQYTKTYKDPITEFQIAECEYESPEYLVIYIHIHMTVFIVNIKEVHESEVQSDSNNEGE